MSAATEQPDDLEPPDAALLAFADLAEQAAGERSYMAQLEPRCEALVQTDPTALAALVAAVPAERLAAPRNRQLLAYYRGLAAGLQDDLAGAGAAFAALLEQEKLDDAVHARALNSGALFAQLRGHDEQALAWYQRSLAIWRRLGNSEREGLALLNMGILQYELQQYPEAEANVRASLARFATAGAAYRLAMAENELGLLCRDQGRWDEALSHFDRAAAGFEREGASDYLGRVWNNLGEVALLRGQYVEALGRFARALELMTTRVYQVDVQVNLGLAHQAQGDDAAALAAYHAARDLAAQIGRADSAPLIHYRIGHAEQRLGRADAALRSYALAITAIEARRAPMRDEGLLISLMGRWQLVYEAAISACLAQGDAAAAFAYAERARARAFADTLARRRELDAAPATPLTAPEVQAALEPGALLVAFFASGLAGPEAALLAALPAEAAGLRACLVAAPRLLRFALTAGELRAAVCPLDPQSLQPGSRFQADGRRFLRPAILRRLHDALLAPVDDMLASADRVIIVPHGPLHQLPFAALLDPHDLPLIERAPRLSYAPSATLVPAVASRPGVATRSCLALGYNGAAERGLRHPEAEAAAVVALCGGHLLPSEPGVTARLLAMAGAYRWLHLACHGEFVLDDPLSSWLELGPGERLSADAIMRELRLDAELVTLSACRSGLSRVLRGDEPLGLARALLGAGARNVLVTLWEVEDHAARRLMEQLYRALSAGAAPEAALSAAQQYLRANGLAEPDDWAAYVVIGAGG